MSVFRADLRRTSRRGWPAMLRAGYALALLVALGGVFAKWFGVGRLAPGEWFSAAADLPIRDVASFAREFAVACFTVQVAAVLVITPALTAGAITEERQRRTLDDLLITGLSSRRIVFGKLFARWVHLNGILFAGLPVLAMTVCWGGVDLMELSLGFAATALLALPAAALGMWTSVEQRTVNAAVLTAYCITPVGLVGLVQASFFAAVVIAMIPYLGTLVASQTLMVVIPCLSLLVFTGIIGQMAARRLRFTDLAVVKDWPPKPKKSRGIPFVRPTPRPRPIPFVRPAPPPTPIVVPDDDDDPLVWRERRVGQFVGHNDALPLWGVIAACALVTAVLVLVLVVEAARGEGGVQLYRASGRLLVFGPLAVLVFAATLSAAVSVTRDRERQTLDGLLTLPGGRPAVLWAKWLGVFGRDRALVWTAAVPLGLGLLLGGFNPLAVPVLAVGVAAQVVFGVSLGLYCSVRAGTTTRAAVAAGLGMLASCVVPLFLPSPAHPLSPAATWWTLPRWGDWLPVDYLVGVPIAAMIQFAAAVGLWRLTRQCFDREADC
jgi:ABC-type transport system involved in multi-copper enzyme maturation permease subunit